MLVNPSTSSLLSVDPLLLPKLQRKNTEELKRLEEKLEDAQKNLGETEISDALRAKALYLARIGDKVRAIFDERDDVGLQRVG